MPDPQRYINLEWTFDAAGVPTQLTPPAGFNQSDCDAAIKRLTAMASLLRALKKKLPKAPKVPKPPKPTVTADVDEPNDEANA